MSYWYEPKKEDISFSDDQREMHIYLASDDFGAIYASLKVEELKELLKDK